LGADSLNGSDMGIGLPDMMFAIPALKVFMFKQFIEHSLLDFTGPFTIVNDTVPMPMLLVYAAEHCSAWIMIQKTTLVFFFIVHRAS
jgi:hypothetical protein